jgi:hypothetical protein
MISRLRLARAVFFDYTAIMRLRRNVFFLFLVVFLPYTPVRLAAQTSRAGDAAGPEIFSLIPLLEAAFNGELRWRPDWPEDIPPDGFSLTGERTGAPRIPVALTLSNGVESFGFERDGAGRLREFPFFSRNACLRVKAVYDSSGAMARMSVDITASAASENETGVDSAGNQTAQSEAVEITWDIEFPPGFFPYGDNSPGGVFPPLKVSRDNASFFVILFESPAFLSETWYDGEGNPLSYFKAPVRLEDGAWRIQSLHFWSAESSYSEEYSFDSGGNISEVRSTDGRFSALYLGNRPRYWERQPASGSQETSHFALQWDERGFLLSLRLEDTVLASEDTPLEPAAGVIPAEDAGTEPPPLEYRYEYGWDTGGNWISRQDIVIISRFGVFIPLPDRVWTRRISFWED